MRQIEKESKLKSLLTYAHRTLERERLYGIRLRPREKQILVASIPALFRKPVA